MPRQQRIERGDACGNRFLNERGWGRNRGNAVTERGERRHRNQLQKERVEILAPARVRISP